MSTYLSVIRSLSVGASVVVLGACGTTSSLTSSLAYSSTQQNPSSPPNGGFAFALRTSTLLIAPPGGASGKQSQAPSGTTAADAPDGNQPLAAAGPPSGTAQVRAKAKPLTGKPKAPAHDQPAGSDKEGSSPVDKSDSKQAGKSVGGGQPTSADRAAGKSADVCVGALAWSDCLRGVAISVVPVSADGPVYVAKPAPPTGYKTTALPKVSAADPLFLTSVTYNTSSNLPTAISNAGSDATAGLVFGPWGAAVGGVFGFLTSFLQASAPPPNPPDWTSLTCSNDPARSLPKSPDSKDSPKLVLPLTVDYKSPDSTGCWNSVPPMSTGTLSDANAALLRGYSGWFYRFTPSTALPPHTSSVPPVILDVASRPSDVIATKDYFTTPAGQAWTSSQTSLPVSACRAVDFQLTRWTELEGQKSGKTADYFEYSIVVADPDYVQQVQAPNQGSITVLTVCGGYASSGTPSTTVSDSISALLKQVQAIRSAQSTSSTKKQ
jgi:hypothetical protein